MALKEHLDIWTYASASSVTTPGDMTGTYWPGMRVVLKQGTLKYFVISSVVYSSPNTTISLDGFGTYTLTSAVITAHIDSPDRPKGFPYPDLATQIKAAIKAYTDTLYAAYGTGVTNGNSHDHVGGDGAQIDHGGLGGVSDDDHSIYALLAGRAGGQVLTGGTAASENLALRSTAHATKGKILFGASAYDELNNRLGIGLNSPGAPLAIKGASTTWGAALRLIRSDNTDYWDILAGGDSSLYFGQNSPTSAWIYFTTTGGIYATGNISALSFTDRTPAFEGDALDVLSKIEADDHGNIDHSTLPDFAQSTDARGQPTRSIGAMVSVLTAGTQQLTDAGKALDKKIEELTKTIKSMNERLTKLESR